VLDRSRRAAEPAGIDDAGGDPASHAEIADSLSVAFLPNPARALYRLLDAIAQRGLSRLRAES
jgi:hypothetical protein